MSTIDDMAAVALRGQLATILGDSATYTHDSDDSEQTVNLQYEPYENERVEEGDDRRVNVQTIATVVIGTETGDVSDVAIGDSVTLDGFIWAVVSIAMRTGATGWARLKIQRTRRQSSGSPGVVLQTPGVAPAGRFDKRGS